MIIKPAENLKALKLEAINRGRTYAEVTYENKVSYKHLKRNRYSKRQVKIMAQKIEESK